MAKHLSFIFIAFMCLGVFSNSSAQEKGIIVNEFSNGPSSSNDEYVELLVVGNSCETVDIRGWVVDDNNGDFSGGDVSGTGVADGHYRFTTHFQWAALTPGTIIVIYKYDDKNGSIPTDDETDSNNDNVFILPSNSSFLEVCSSNPNSSDDSYLGCGTYVTNYTGTPYPIGLRNGGDAIQTRKPDYSYFHGLSYEDSNFDGGPDGLHLPTGGSAINHFFIDTDYRDITNFSNGSVPADETPGAANNAANAAYIANLMASPSSSQRDLVTTDTSFCFGDSVLLVVENGYDTYEWSNGVLNDSIYINSAGQFWVKVTRSGCEYRDTVDVTISTPIVEAGHNISICINDTITLSGSGNGTPNWTPVSRIIDENTFTPKVFPTTDETYYLTVTDGAGCKKTDSVLVTVNALPSVTATANPINICPGDSTLLEASGAKDYVWKPASTIAFPDSSKTKAATLVSDSTVFTVIGTDVNGCIDSTTTTVYSLDYPELLNINNVSFCNGDSGTVELIFSGQKPYDLKYAIGTDTNTFNFNSDTLSITSDSTVTIQLVSLSDGGCAINLDTSLTFTELFQPTIQFPDDTTVCSGTSVSLPFLISATEAVTITTKQPDKSTVILGPFSQDSVNVVLSDTGRYVFTEITHGVCTYSIEDTVNIAYFNTPQISLSASGDFCHRESFLIEADFVGTPDFTVGYYNKTNDTTFVTVTQDSLAIFLTQTDSLSFFYFSDLNCEAQVNNVVSANQISQPKVTISGDSLFCENDSSEVIFNFSGDLPYNFTFTSNGVITNENNYTSSSYSFYVKDSTHIAFTQLGNNTCDSSFTLTKTVKEKPVPTAIISGGNNICAGDSSIISIRYTGSPNFTIGYYNQNNDTTYTTINQDSLQIIIKETSTLHFFHLNDAFCDGVIDQTVAIVSQTQPTVNLLSDSTLCDGDSTLVSFNLSGDSPYNFSFTYNGVTNTVSNYSNNSYQFYVDTTTTIIITQLGNATCDTTLNIQNKIVEKPLPTAMLSGNDSICPGDSSLVTINFTGTPPFNGQILRNNSNYNTFSTNSFSYSFYTEDDGLYTVSQVSDAFCSNSGNGSFLIHKHQQRGVQIGSTNYFCENDSTSVTFSYSGNEPWNVYYTLNGTPDSAVNVTSTSFLFYVKDSTVVQIQSANGFCNATLPNKVTITQKDTPVASVSGGGIVCDGSTLPKVTIIMKEDGPFTLSYFEGSTQHTNIFNNDTLIISPTAEGYYGFTELKDTYGCKSTLSDSVFAGFKPNPVAFAGNDTLVCSGDQITLGTSPSAGNTYTWSHPNLLSDNTISNPQTTNNFAVDTTIKFVVTAYLNGCPKSDQIFVNYLAPYKVSYNNSSLVCYKDTTGSLEINAIGGASDYRYSIDGTVPPTNPSNLFSNLSADTFDVNIIDSVGCSFSDVVIVKQPDSLELNLSVSHPVCAGETNGSITVNATGGTVASDYTYYLNASQQPSNAITGLGQGTFFVSIEDDNGCTASSQPITLTELSAINIDSVSTFNPSCFGECDGKLVVWSDSAATYAINSGTTQVDSSFKNLCDDTYFIIVTDQFGCTDNSTVALVEPTEIILPPLKDTTICVGGSALYKLNPSGGSGNYTYHWDFTTTVGDTNRYDEPGSYLAYVLDVENNCASNTVSFEVNEYGSLYVFIDLDVTDCTAEHLDLTAIASGGLQPYNYVWAKANDATYSASTQEITVPVADKTIYTVTLTDACETPFASADIENELPAPPTVNFDVPDPDCAPFNATLINTSETNGEVFTARWDLSDTRSFSSFDSCSFEITNATCVDVTLYLYNENGCEFQGPTKPVCAKPTPRAEFLRTPEGPYDQINNLVQYSGTEQLNTEYKWYKDGFYQADTRNWYTYIENDSTEVCLYVENKTSGCADTLCETLYISPKLVLFVPTGFTPGKDGINDTFFPVVSGGRPESYVFEIYNRWGERIFESGTIGEGWDGTYKGEDSPSGIYSYRIYIKEIESALLEEHIGAVTLIR